jgi:phosphate transport system substrate-binding protein
MAWVKNGAGVFKFADETGAAKAIDQAKVNADGSVTMNFTTTAAGAYPISAVTYLVIPVKVDGKKVENLKAFVTYALGVGQKKASRLSYVPLPPKIIAAAKANLAKVTKK